MRISLKLLGVLLLLGAAMFLYGLFEARRDPVVRRATVTLADWPKDARPIRVALLSDLHVGSVTMTPARLGRIADQAMAQKPDLILLAGDFIAGHTAADAARAAPDLAAGLSRLQAPLGLVAVLGNHDHASDPVIVRRALAAARVTVLANGAARRGPLVIGGIDDVVTDHKDVPATLAAMDRLAGARILINHGPAVDAFLRPPKLKRMPQLPPQIVLAGHTHCGQIVLPLVGAVAAFTERGHSYSCGIVTSGPDRLIVTAGLGTSVLPVRIGAPPDFRLLTIGPARR